MPRIRKTPEARLATYWRKRAGIAWSDFDVFQGIEPPEGFKHGRSPYWIATEENLREGKPFESFDKLVLELGLLILRGYPLNRFEYHVAVACGYLLADGIPYETFYRKHWYETAERRGYGRRPRKASRKHSTTRSRDHEDLPA